MKCRRPKKPRSNSGVKTSGKSTVSAKTSVTLTSDTLPSNTRSKSSTQIVLRNLRQARLLRQASRSQSPPKYAESFKPNDTDSVGTTGLLLNEAHNRFNKSYNTEIQAIKIAVAENKWNELKREMSQYSSNGTQVNVTQSGELPKKGSNPLQNYLQLSQRRFLQTSFAFPSQKRQKGTLPKSHHVKQFSQLAPKPKKNIIDIAIAVKASLEQCQARHKALPKTGSYFGTHFSQARVSNNKHAKYPQDESTDENSRVNVDYLCVKKTFLKPITKPAANSKRGRLRIEINDDLNVSQYSKKLKVGRMKDSVEKKKVDTASNDTTSQSETVVGTENENSGEEAAICCPRETQQPKLLGSVMHKSKCI